MPAFSTTTRVDETVSAMLMMASMKSYFEFVFAMECGIPSVTLEGTKDDWIEIQARLEKLGTWGNEADGWYRLLRPVISKFIAAFDGEVDTNFWGHIVSSRSFGSGDQTLGGWITAFCVFTGRGKYHGNVRDFWSGIQSLAGATFPPGHQDYRRFTERL